MATTLIDTGYTPSVDAKLTDKGYEVKRQYNVNVPFNEKGDDVELNVINTFGLPSIGSPVSNSYPNVLCSNIIATPADNGNDDGDFLTWRVDVTYKTPDRDDKEGAINPLDEAPVVSFGSTQYERVADKSYYPDDKEGEPTKPVENSIGDPFDPPLIIPKSNQYITIQQNLATFNPAWIIQYENTANKSKMTIVGIDVEPEQARMLSIRGNNALDSEGNEYWIVSYEIEVNKETFVKKILNSGLNHFVEGVGKLPIKYKDLGNFEGTEKEGDEFVNDPQKLSESGGIIFADSAEKPFYPEHTVYFPKSWNTLSIPSRSS